MVGVLAVTYVLSLFAKATIFGLAVWSFTGFSGLFPLVLAALFWRRATRHGAYAAIVTVAALWIYFFQQGFGVAGYSAFDTGLAPVVVIFAASSLVLVVVSLLTPPPSAETLHRFFPGSVPLRGRARGTTRTARNEVESSL